MKDVQEDNREQQIWQEVAQTIDEIKQAKFVTVNIKRENRNKDK